MAEIDDHINKLHDKFFNGTISDEEKQKLYDFYKDQVCVDGKVIPRLLDRFLYVSHPDYGKPDKNGLITIV